jgi:hypothetical protein
MVVGDVLQRVGDAGDEVLLADSCHVIKFRADMGWKFPQF